MIDPSRFFESSQHACQRCGTVNQFGSSEALFQSDPTRRCSHCGYPFVAHTLRVMSKTMEMLMTSPEWVQRFNDNDWDWMKRQMDELVPIDDDGASS